MAGPDEVYFSMLRAMTASNREKTWVRPRGAVKPTSKRNEGATDRLVLSRLIGIRKLV
jgi:hypothetical protein